MSKFIRPFLYSAAIAALGLTALTAYFSAEDSQVELMQTASAEESTMQETASMLNEMMPAAGESYQVAGHHEEGEHAEEEMDSAGSGDAPMDHHIDDEEDHGEDHMDDDMDHGDDHMDEGHH